MTFFANRRAGGALVVGLAVLLTACGGGGGGGESAAVAWEEAKRISPVLDHDALTPKIVMDGEGNGLAVWTRRIGSGNQSELHVWASRYTQAGGWGAALRLDSTLAGESVYEPMVAMDAAGNALVAWTTYVQGNYQLWLRRYVAGTGWQVPVLHAADTSPDLFPIAMDTAGNALLAWTKNENGQYSIKAQRLEAATDTWSAVATRETGADDRPYGFQAGMNASGNAILTWQQEAVVQVGGVLTMHAWQSLYWGESNSLSAPARLSDGTSRADSPPLLTVTPAGDAMAAWSQVWPGQEDRRVGYAYFQNMGAGWNIATGELATGAGWAVPMAVAGNAQGRILLAWGHTPATDLAAPDGADWSVRASACSVAGCAGSALLVSHPMHSISVATPAQPTLAMDAAGNALAIWNLPRKQEDGSYAYRLQARYQPAGKGWSGPMTVSDGDIPLRSLPGLAMSTNGKAMAVWAQADSSGKGAIWARRSR